eukprot:TRINITY_DN872_c0_g2_i2.p1 TRINITY_DN872_c0_g2~~TRINITY_DN872_c0_g2_i2.p1  ORF type:complete len:438 (-),score=129.48 TRINITY_DN872_c0_g2_i2:24-1337(-)
MSAKKIKKFGNIDIPVSSLLPPDKDGYLTKQGGSIKSWHKRYFILKDKTLYYYKTPKDTQITGKIDLEPTSSIKEETKGNKPNMFSLSISKRVFSMHADKGDAGYEEIKSWIAHINKAIERTKPNYNSNGPSTSMPTSNSYLPSNNNNSVETKPVGSKPTAIDMPHSTESRSPRVKLSLAKHQVAFLKDEESKVLEFWQIWSDSIPSREDLTPGLSSIDFTVATSADMQKLTWRTAGPQNIFIQKMVDFFWNVGAPESEIDRLNDVGALINPIRIGSWIDMSSKGGMDGGWFFPVEMPLKLAAEAADSGDAIRTFTNWADSNNISQVYAVGRDMGAAPPRQTELRIKLPGSTLQNQVNLGLSAFTAFDFPPVPDDVVRMTQLKNGPSADSCCLSVITSSEGFVRLGLMIPKPNTETVLALLDIGGCLLYTSPSPRDA